MKKKSKRFKRRKKKASRQIKAALERIRIAREDLRKLFLSKSTESMEKGSLPASVGLMVHPAGGSRVMGIAMENCSAGDLVTIMLNSDPVLGSELTLPKRIDELILKREKIPISYKPKKIKK